MTGLVLKLSPRERLLVNGAVIENGDKRARISILTANANILRLRDAVHPNEAHSPVRRLCYSVQLVLSGDRGKEAAQLSTLHKIDELYCVFTDPNSRRLLTCAKDAVIGMNYYQCLKSLKGLIAQEDRLLAACSR